MQASSHLLPPACFHRHRHRLLDHDAAGSSAAQPLQAPLAPQSLEVRPIADIFPHLWNGKRALVEWEEAEKKLLGASVQKRECTRTLQPSAGDAAVGRAAGGRRERRGRGRGGAPDSSRTQWRPRRCRRCWARTWPHINQLNNSSMAVPALLPCAIPTKSPIPPFPPFPPLPLIACCRDPYRHRTCDLVYSPVGKGARDEHDDHRRDLVQGLQC